MLLVGLIAGTAAWAQSPAEPSLAEIAKQKPVKKAKRVITDDDLPKHEAETKPASQAGEGAADGSAGAAVAADKDASTDPAASQSAKPGATEARNLSPEDALKVLRMRVEFLREDEQRLQQKYKELRERMDTEENDFRKQVIQGELDNSGQNLAALRQRRESAEKELSEKEKQLAEKEAAAKQKSAAPASSD